MKDFEKIFLDTSPLIYFLDNVPNFGDKSRKIIDFLLEENKVMISSVVTCEEYLVMPYRNNEQTLINSFWKFVIDSKMSLYPINQSDAVKAAEIRAEYKHFKPLDSLQLAVACLQGCDLFLTNDKQLKQFDEIKCVTVEEWELK